MKNEIRNGKGITLITLVITVIVIGILASVATYSGIDVINSSKLARFTTEMKLIQTKVNELYEDRDAYTEKGDDVNETEFNEKINIIGKTYLESLNYSVSYSDYRLYNKSTLESELGIEDVEQSVFIDIKNRKVISYEGIKVDGENYYVIEQLPNSLYNVDYEENTTTITDFSIKAEKIEDNKWRITVSDVKSEGKEIEKWQVKYQLEDGNESWYTSDNLSFVLEKRGRYNIKIVNGNVESNLKSVVLWQIYDKNTEYMEVDENNNIKKAIIPAGFVIPYDSDRIDEGLVISDIENDDLSNSAKGNQFVWIPVNKETFDSKFKRQNGYKDGSNQLWLENCGEADVTGVNQKMTESSITQKEAQTMYASVNKNSGFYIARYETGKETIDEEIKVVSKKEADSYTNIQWGDSMTSEGEGAVKEARYMSEKNGYKSVTSTLCYGVQWDAALNFIDQNYITNAEIGTPICDSDSYIVNSAGKGWYANNYNTTTNGNTSKNEEHKTGKDLIYSDDLATISNKVKNIYDMAGNLWEWTMESYSYTTRVCRGGNYGSYGDSYPSSFRMTTNPTTYAEDIGFRIALFIN